jgi:hypothetical protein
MVEPKKRDQNFKLNMKMSPTLLRYLVSLMEVVKQHENYLKLLILDQILDGMLDMYLQGTCHILSNRGLQS